MMRKPREHDTRQSSHNEDESTARRGLGIMSPYFPYSPLSLAELIALQISASTSKRTVKPKK
jgi:hypothetical protein